MCAERNGTEQEACHVTPTWKVLVGDVREQLAAIPDGTFQCCVTSPPYWGLRDYNMAGQFGLEPTPALYVAVLVDLFRDVRRVLKDDGVFWLNIGDCFLNAKGQAGGIDPKNPARRHLRGARPNDVAVKGLKRKDLVGIPWMLAFALRTDGWYLRADVIWSKPNPMPESIKDRPTKSHEYVFLLSKSERYFYNADAIAEPASLAMHQQMEQGYDGLGIKDYESAGVQDPSGVKARIIANARRKNEQSGDRRKVGFNDRWDAKERETLTSGKHSTQDPHAAGRRIVENVARARAERGADHDNPFGVMRNARSVWTIPTQPYSDAHFATFPEALPERCIKAGSRLGDMVFDPFCGSGTTGQVAIQLGRSFIGIELNPAYAKLARKRIGNAAPLFAEAVS